MSFVMCGNHLVRSMEFNLFSFSHRVINILMGNSAEGID